MEEGRKPFDAFILMPKRQTSAEQGKRPKAKSECTGYGANGTKDIGRHRWPKWEKNEGKIRWE